MPEGNQPFKDEKTEPPSSKKLNKQKRDGNVFMSQEMAIVIVIFLGAWIIKFFASWIFRHLYSVMISQFHNIAWLRLDNENIAQYLVQNLLFIGTILAPVCLALMLAGSFATLSQTGWVVSWKKAKWDVSKIFKINWKQLLPFDQKKTVDLLLNIGKVALILTVLFYSFKHSLNDWIPFMDATVIDVWYFMCDLFFKIVIKICVILFVLAIIDFIYKRKKYMDDLKMTKWEVKEERKMADGDPKIKAALKSKRFALFRRIMMESVPQADVIITNPTHFAVALKYEVDTMEAPKVIAKGMGKIAEKIKEIAGKHDIPIVENKPLAQVLFKTVEVGEYIPATLYKAVAEILAYVYRLKNKKAA